MICAICSTSFDKGTSCPACGSSLVKKFGHAAAAEPAPQESVKLDPLTGFALAATVFVVFMTYRAWVITTMWNWFGVLFVKRPITLAEGVAVALLIATVKRPDHNDGREESDPRSGAKRFVKVCTYQALVVGVGWIAHKVLFS